MRSPQAEFSWGGLNTRASATGLPLLDCVVLQDMRLVGTDLVERLGCVRLGQVSGNTKAMDFVAASSEECVAPVDTRVWEPSLYWTLEIAFEPDSASGTQGIFVAGHTTPSMELYIDSSDNIIFKSWDEDGAAVSVTVGAAAASLQTVQIVRDGASLVSRLNNVAGGTGTMEAAKDMETPVGDFRLGRDDESNYFDGTIDYLRLMSIVKSDHNDRLIRLPNPRARHVLADYDGNITAGLLVPDRSRYENHLVADSGVSEVTSLCHNPAHIRAISMGLDEDNKRQLFLAAGGIYYLASVD